jgi:RNA-binding protein YhbY
MSTQTDWQALQERDENSAQRAGLTESALREIRDSENLIRITTYTHNTMEHMRAVRSAVAALLTIVVISLIGNVLVALSLLTR